MKRRNFIMASLLGIGLGVATIVSASPAGDQEHAPKSITVDIGTAVTLTRPQG